MLTDYAITNVEAWRIPAISIKETWDSDLSPWPTTPINFLVKVTLASGVHGVGEVSAQLWYLNETPEQIESVIRLYADVLKGADASNLSDYHERMLRCYGGGAPGARTARCGVDMALWDALGKMTGLPVYKLMGGGHPDRIPLMFCTYQTTPELVVRDCQSAIDQGYQAVKVKVGDSLLSSGWTYATLVNEADKLAAALKAIPDHIMVDADANQAWRNAGVTIATLRNLAAHRNLSIEQPLGYDDIPGAAHVRKTLGVPVVLDESVWSAEAMVRIVKAEACARIVFTLNRLGGFFEARKVIDISEAAGIGVSVDTAPFTLLGDTAVFHAAASCQTVLPVDEGHLSMIAISGPAPFTGGVTIEAGRASLPNRPGLGIDVDWKIVSQWSS
ncbi:MAG: mandelate racemase/muconate lactonizing enzyme family protein [Novosphingobium sp.]|nr:mandelate racemase/muconate lactonizing enzyme family protein [Novosphingobium sp.]